jgi:hypothetical protein
MLMMSTFAVTDIRISEPKKSEWAVQFQRRLLLPSVTHSSVLLCQSFSWQLWYQFPWCKKWHSGVFSNHIAKLRWKIPLLTTSVSQFVWAEPKVPRKNWLVNSCQKPISQLCWHSLPTICPLCCGTDLKGGCNFYTWR